MNRNRPHPRRTLELLISRVLTAPDIDNGSQTSSPSLHNSSLLHASIELISKQRTLARIRDEVAAETGNTVAAFVDPNGSNSKDFISTLSSRLHPWLVRVSSLLTSRSEYSRRIGATLVKETVVQCPELFPSYFATWTAGLMNHIRRPETSPHAILGAGETLFLLFRMSSDFPELYRDVTATNVGKLVEALLSVAEKSDSDHEVQAAVLRQLFDILTTFSSLAKAQAPNIEKLSLRFLTGGRDTPSTLPGLAADCLGGLCLIGGKGAIPQVWHARLVKTLGSAHTELNILLRSVEESSRPPQPTQILDLPPIQHGDYLSCLPARLNRLSSLTVCVARLLGASFISSEVQAPVELLLSFCERISSVYEGMDLKHPPDVEEASILMSILPQLYGGAARVLMSTMMSLKDLLLPYIRTISGIVKRLLMVEHSDSTRLIAYALLETAIDFYGAGFLLTGDGLQDILLCTLYDIIALTPDQAATSASSAGDAQTSENTSWKKQKRQGQGQVHVSTSSPKIVVQGPKVAVAVAASKALSAILRNLPSQKLPATLPNTILRQVLHYSSKLPDQLREIQYRCLLDLVLAEPNVRGLTGAASKAFSIGGANDPREDIRLFCQHATFTMDSVIHPRFPPYGRPPLPSEDREKVSPDQGGFGLARFAPSTRMASRETHLETYRLGETSEATRAHDMDVEPSSIHMPVQPPELSYTFLAPAPQSVPVESETMAPKTTFISNSFNPPPQPKPNPPVLNPTGSTAPSQLSAVNGTDTAKILQYSFNDSSSVRDPQTAPLRQQDKDDRSHLADAMDTSLGSTENKNEDNNDDDFPEIYLGSDSE
ncbi:hypothetical protein M427DRAFT_53559 [Gonapodya prolifera JEL478]|uniref:Pre-rRNA-processing protein RIX1 n=1 Tax=Gonapodya prolifera (strain JEL478) TaxID=1344416 RepID=A0A139APD0_GONPJ|nr:hypothetical protein M427DRAFT_53559 [Gonapodya prolifera JEL478]|eukprot:KXS18600.1 hypothetical protein M427DRAFT_53559 [Gonapodya prolifera JEL478]